jgi:flavin-dependent dehydrogenase
MPESAQVLVIGGGPAGATVAGLLAREGMTVVLAERERFPRYHIGESILPSSLSILDLLGAKDKVSGHGFQIKRGVLFRWGPDNWSLSFNELGDDTPYAWQVVRSEFDQILLDHAAELGADVRQGVTVKDLRFDRGRAVAATWSESRNSIANEISFDYLVDASGRSGVLANRYLKNRRFNDMFKNVAVWQYWAGAPALAGAPEGSTGVFSTPGGWFWTIPLHDGTLSVGLVTGRDAFSERRNELGGSQEVYEEAVSQCPGVRDLLAGARPTSPVRIEQDYSYAADAFTAPGCLLAGDAACFLDPLLSTGVHLATYSGMVGAAAIATVLRGEMAEEEAFGFYERSYRRAYERMVLLVSAFYQTYRGKDYHFYHAQRLSARDKESLRLHETFLRIASGIEDMEDAKSAAYDLAVDELIGGRAPGESPFRYIPEMRAEPTSARNAIGGLYVRLDPPLGLARVSAGVRTRGPEMRAAQ